MLHHLFALSLTPPKSLPSPNSNKNKFLCLKSLDRLQKTDPLKPFAARGVHT